MTVQLKAQIIPEKLKRFTGSENYLSAGLHNPDEVKEFYNYREFRPCWLAEKDHNNLRQLSAFIHEAAELGLIQDDYHPLLFRKVADRTFSPSDERDSLLAELRLTDAAVHFVHDVMTGNRPGNISYNGLNYTPSCYNIPLLLNTCLNAGRFPLLQVDAEPKDPGYLAVKRLLNHLQKIIAVENFSDEVVTLSRVNRSNKALLVRLYQLGIVASVAETANDSLLKIKIKEAQRLLGIPDDGVLGSITLGALNKPLAVRITELEYTLNTLRWLSCIKQASQVIVVNIPSATLLLYHHGKVVLESRVIVGKKTTPTPTLCSRIHEVILYPYWHVPHKIATQELLPVIRRNPGFLNANNYQVLNKDGKIMNPAVINWQALNSSYFPYLLRQSTGCDNALGLIKLNFSNPFSVYLHDTPWKSLFRFNRRYFSHGCMRIEKAMELAHYVLKNNTIAIDTLEEKGCLRNQAPVPVPVSESIPVFVLYHTAWIDSAANISFHEDVYRKLSPSGKIR
jgi:murein L,D-transpeptidase YcbB/YkuD